MFFGYLPAHGKGQIGGGDYVVYLGRGEGGYFHSNVFRVGDKLAALGVVQHHVEYPVAVLYGAGPKGLEQKAQHHRNKVRAYVKKRGNKSLIYAEEHE